jgi:hypothetical protein
MPLIITHGWPRSVVEFHKVIETFDRSDRAWRQCRGRVSCRLPIIAGLCFSAKPTTKG